MNLQNKAKELPGPSYGLDRDDKCVLFEQNPLTLCFKSKSIEHTFLKEVASSRFPVLVAIASFDVCIFAAKLALKLLSSSPQPLTALWWAFVLQLQNLAALYTLIGVIHWHSRKSGRNAIQGELLLATLIALVLSILITSNSSTTSWVIVSFFLICTPQVLRFRWFVGAISMAIPVALVAYRHYDSQHTTTNEYQDIFHLSIAWAVGTLTGILSDASRRQAFANHRRAIAAASTEIIEARARVAAEHELASAQALAEARSLLADREKASNEAKSEFISMLCHEIRTPLNGCLASAEMLLETNLDADQKELAHTVRVSGSILLSTVSNFLDFFKLEAGKPLDVVRSPLDLSVMVSDVHRIIEAMIGSGGDVELLPPDLSGAPHTVQGDPSRLCGILLNMYMNAAKFTRRGSIGLKVHVVPKQYRPKPESSLRRQSPSSNSRSSSLGRSSSSRSGSSSELDAAISSNDDEQRRHHVTTAGGKISWSTESDHDSVASIPHHNRRSTNEQNRKSLEASMHSIRMLVQDEGDGWLSTSSELRGNPSGGARAQGQPGGHEEWIAFEVHDTGVGVPPKSLHALFHDYVQGDISDMQQPRTRSGTGLGLAICGKQVAIMGGVIGALSKPDAGSVFWFKVPMVVHDGGVVVGDGSGDNSGVVVVGGVDDGSGGGGGGGDRQVQPDVANDHTTEQQHIHTSTTKDNTDPTTTTTNNNNNTTTIISNSPRNSYPSSPLSSSSSLSRRTSFSQTHLPRPSSGQHLSSESSSLNASLQQRWQATPNSSMNDLQYRGSIDGVISYDGNVATTIMSNIINNTVHNSSSGGGGGGGNNIIHPSSPTTSSSLPSPPPHIIHTNTTTNTTTNTNITTNTNNNTNINMNGPLAGLRILVAEDNLINRKVACRVLTSLGALCEVASNGQEAVNSIIACEQSNTRLDAVLMDMCMPVMGGVEATKAIRKHGSTVPVIAMTANALEKDKEECLAAGMDGFMSKPVLREQLSECIMDVYRRKQIENGLLLSSGNGGGDNDNDAA